MRQIRFVPSFQIYQRIKYQSNKQQICHRRRDMQVGGRRMKVAGQGRRLHKRYISHSDQSSVGFQLFCGEVRRGSQKAMKYGKESEVVKKYNKNSR